MEQITAEHSISGRLALAVCEFGCPDPCPICRERSAAVAHEVAAILRERHGGSSATADWLDGVGCHQQEESRHG